MISIRQATKLDIPLIVSLGKQTFVESFAHLNDPEHFEKFLAQQYAPENIEKEFFTEKVEFYIALYANEPAGFIKIIFDEDEDHPLLTGKKCLELERIYVLQKFQGLRIGLTLLQRVFEIARGHNCELVWLGVWEENHKAINFYQKSGFKLFGNHPFNLGGDIQTDLLMMKEV